MKFLKNYKKNKLVFFIILIFLIISSFTSLILYYKFKNVYHIKSIIISNQIELHNRFIQFLNINNENDENENQIKTNEIFLKIEKNITAMIYGGEIILELENITLNYSSISFFNEESKIILKDIITGFEAVKQIINSETNYKTSSNHTLKIHNEDIIKNLNTINKINAKLFEKNILYILIIQTILSIIAVIATFFIFNNDFKLTIAEDKISNYIKKAKENNNHNISKNIEVKELKRSNKDLESFAYITSHDLKEPLRMVTSYAELLHEKYYNKLDEKANKYIDYIIKGSNTMLILMDDLLSYSKVKTHKYVFEKINISKIIESVISNLEMKIKENNAKIIFNNLPEMVGDRILFIELFQNLINNAIKYRKDKIPPIVEINYSLIENEYIFSVSDNGIGIEDKYFEKIFILFERLHNKNQYSGNGIGLAIVKSIVDKHGGKIWIESEINTGSTFYFTIPINIR